MFRAARRGYLSMTLGSGVHERELAWALADIAKPGLGKTERNQIYVALGVGDYFAAIRLLVNVIHREDLPMSADLAAAFTSWLTAYEDDTLASLLRDQFARLRRPPRASPVDHRMVSLPIAGRYSRAPRRHS